LFPRDFSKVLLRSGEGHSISLSDYVIVMTPDTLEVVAYLMAARRSGREKGDGLSKARRLRLLVGTFLLPLSVILTGCSGSVTQEQKEEKKKTLKKTEAKDKEKKKEK
jgi:hypothetical protein